MHFVLVSGVLVIDEGKMTDALPGKVTGRKSPKDGRSF
jgi:hypothetical protein